MSSVVVVSHLFRPVRVPVTEEAHLVHEYGEYFVHSGEVPRAMDVLLELVGAERGFGAFDLEESGARSSGWFAKVFRDLYVDGRHFDPVVVLGSKCGGCGEMGKVRKGWDGSGESKSQNFFLGAGSKVTGGLEIAGADTLGLREASLLPRN